MASRKATLVARALVVHDGKVLAAHHQHEDGDDFWCLPGGKVKPDERVEDAARRELHGGGRAADRPGRGGLAPGPGRRGRVRGRVRRLAGRRPRRRPRHRAQPQRGPEPGRGRLARPPTSCWPATSARPPCSSCSTSATSPSCPDPSPSPRGARGLEPGDRRAQQLGQGGVDLLEGQAAGRQLLGLQRPQALAEGDRLLDRPGVVGPLVDQLEQRVLGVGVAAKGLQHPGHGQPLGDRQLPAPRPAPAARRPARGPAAAPNGRPGTRPGRRPAGTGPPPRPAWPASAYRSASAVSSSRAIATRRRSGFDPEVSMSISCASSSTATTRLPTPSSGL